MAPTIRQVAANALFLAAAPLDVGVARSSPSSRTCGRIRAWPSRNSPTTTSRYWPARAASTPDVVAKIGAGARGVDAVEMNDVNISALSEVTSGPPGTPTVYDVKSEQIVDISDPDWLSLLMRQA